MQEWAVIFSVLFQGASRALHGFFLGCASNLFPPFTAGRFLLK
jgi:hypothetical protein